MLDSALSNRPTHRCTTRRDFLRVGSLALGGLSLSGSLNAQPHATNSKPRAKSVILLFLGGGLSHLDTLDPRPNAPSHIRGKYQPIRTPVPGLHISEKLPLLARMMDRVSLVRSMMHTSDHHETATNWVLSGRPGSPFGDYPAAGAVVAHELGGGGAVPPHVAVPHNPAFTWELGKSAFLGNRHESFKTGDPNQAHRLHPSRAFALDHEPNQLRDRYGRTTVGQSMLLARRLVEHGTRFVTVNSGGWDHHANLYDALDQKLPEFDRGLSALIEDLDTRGTLHETLVVMMSEFGRSPHLNLGAGRDHWPHASSILLAGAGVKRGFVLGQTDPHGAYATDRPISPADVVATILDSVGIDPRKSLPHPNGRPIPVLDQGHPVKGLFA